MANNNKQNKKKSYQNSSNKNARKGNIKGMQQTFKKRGRFSEFFLK